MNHQTAWRHAKTLFCEQKYDSQSKGSLQKLLNADLDQYWQLTLSHQFIIFILEATMCTELHANYSWE